MSFLTEYFGIIEVTKEQAVACPFYHHTASGMPYKETRPSAHVNTEEKLFHCKACNTGLSELQFIQKVLGCEYAQARKLQNVFTTEETVADWDAGVSLTEETKQRALALGISEEVIKELKIGTPAQPFRQNIISFPVFMYDHLLDIRNYDPGQTPKIRSRKDSLAGLIIPFDLWRETDPNKITIICAGEKDLAIARTHGFNAITITGGERAIPVALEYFRNRRVVICYDNDEAGKDGAKNLANTLCAYAKEVKVITNFHEVCKE
jgi:5S rRNA maturation endonuclease (ribonuclease M5)